MTTPSAALVAELRQLPGDLIILGVGGKIGPTLARLAKRAVPDKRVAGMARFSEGGLREQLRRGTGDGLRRADGCSARNGSRQSAARSTCWSRRPAR